MKKIYVNESSINAIRQQRMLPKFLFRMVKAHTTSLGDNAAFPNGGDYPFDYTVLKKRYSDVCDEVESLNLESLNEDYLMTELNSLIKTCKDLERPIRDVLERICENAVNRLFAIPSGMINLSCKLVEKVTFKNAVRVKPESEGEAKYTFDDLEDIEFSNKVIEKRRFINSLIQGASYTYSRKESLYRDEIDKVNKDLMPLYRKIIAINNYLLFTKKEELTDDKPMQGSYVETHVGNEDDKAVIEAQGIIFPLLLQETIKGLFDLFSAHSLPKDKQKAKYIISKADFILAEPWDMRLGVEMWNKKIRKIDDTNIIPYVFTSYIKLPTDEFNNATKEMFSNTRKGDEILGAMIDTATYDSGYEAFTNRINARNINKSVINDSYFTAAELDGFQLDSDEEDEDMIEEYGYILKDNVFYRGTCGNINVTDFGLNKEYTCAWLSETPEYAAMYAEDCEDGHLYEITVDLDRYNGYDWWEADDDFDPYDGFSREQQGELMKQGYNGYSFALDEGTVFVLFDPSLITNVREIPLKDYLEEATINPNTNENVDFAELILNATENDIRFANGGKNSFKSNCFNAIVTVNGTKIPRELVDIELQIVPLRLSEQDTIRLPQIHIVLSESIRGQGLGTKLYKALINQFGGIYSGGGRRVNDESISAIYRRLSKEPNIDVYEVENDVVKDTQGNNTIDYIAIKNN